MSQSRDAEDIALAQVLPLAGASIRRIHLTNGAGRRTSISIDPTLLALYEMLFDEAEHSPTDAALAAIRAMCSTIKPEDHPQVSLSRVVQGKVAEAIARALRFGVSPIPKAER